MSETITWLVYRGYRSGAVQLQQLIEESAPDGRLTIAWVDADIHAEAWRIFLRYDDQTFSFCDCTSFALCFQNNVDFVFGFDRDFRIVGLDLRPGS